MAPDPLITGSFTLLYRNALTVKIENIMLMSFDIKFIRRDKKQRRDGEACRASPTCFWSGLINLTSKDTNMVYIYHALLEEFKI